MPSSGKPLNQQPNRDPWWPRGAGRYQLTVSRITVGLLAFWRQYP